MGRVNYDHGKVRVDADSVKNAKVDGHLSRFDMLTYVVK